MNLGSLSLHYLDLSGSPLDAVDLNSKSARDILSSIRKLTRLSDITKRDDQFTIDHRSCCIGAGLISHANNIIESVDGIELETVASGHLLQMSHPQVSSLVRRYHHTHDLPPFEAEMRFTAVPNDTEFWREVTTASQVTSDTRFAWCPKLRCNYCPGFEYSLFQHPNDSLLICTALECHLTNSLHRERVRRRRPEIRRRRAETDEAMRRCFNA